jgi:hypothetical protein
VLGVHDQRDPDVASGPANVQKCADLVRVDDIGTKSLQQWAESTLRAPQVQTRRLVNTMYGHSHGRRVQTEHAGLLDTDDDRLVSTIEARAAQLDDELLQATTLERQDSVGDLQRPSGGWTLTNRIRRFLDFEHVRPARQSRQL